MSKMISKLTGGLLIAGLLAAFLPGQAFGAAVTISVSGITQNGGGNVASGAFVQVIQSGDSAIGAPDTSGNPTGDTVAVTGTINPDGTFQSGASIPSNNYVTIRVWQTWDGTGTPTGYYGTGPAEDVGAGFVYTYDPAGFACDTQYGAVAPPTGPSISGILPAAAYPGQTIVISGSDFGDTKGSSAVTIGGVLANPTAWSASSITLAVPGGASDGTVRVTVGGESASSSVTIQTGGVVIDDVEGGSVGAWGRDNGLADSGYYAYGSGLTPDAATITADGPQAAAARDGARGMQIAYSYDGLEDFGGWGARLANTLDLSAFDTVSFYIRWDNSTNDIKFSLQDSADHVYYATVSNVTLTSLSGYGKVTLNKTAFAEDLDNPERTEGALDWAAITKYNFTFTTQGTAVGNQYIDSLTAGEVDLGGGDTPPPPEPGGEVVITDIKPAVGPAGTRFTANGSGFGAMQGQSILIFENSSTGTNYPVDIAAWSDTSIEAIVPRLAPAGNYFLKVVKIAVAAGTVSAFESNSENFRVTAMMSAAGIATIFPNPFNPLEQRIPASRASGMAANQATIAYRADGLGTANIGIYIYDSTARLVHHEITGDTQVSWDGKDQNGGYVADGVYLLRVVNEDSRALLAKGKILVVKSK